MYFKLHVCELFSSEWVNSAIKRYIMFQGLSQLGKIYIYLLCINIKNVLKRWKGDNITAKDISLEDNIEHYWNKLFMANKNVKLCFIQNYFFCYDMLILVTLLSSWYLCWAQATVFKVYFKTCLVYVFILTYMIAYHRKNMQWCINTVLLHDKIIWLSFFSKIQKSLKNLTLKYNPFTLQWYKSQN